MTASSLSNAGRFHDVVVIGDGPAGSALACACVMQGLDVVLIGDDADWSATYGAWLDDLDRVSILSGLDVTAGAPLDVSAWTDRRHELKRPYTILDNAALHCRESCMGVSIRGVDRSKRRRRAVHLPSRRGRTELRLDRGHRATLRMSPTNRHHHR